MIALSELQLDALAEIFNVGAGRAASSLSEIVGDEVKMSVPRVQFFHSSEVNASALSMDSLNMGAVRQHFSGPFSAEAMLLFTEERALEIVRDMMGSQLSVAELAEFEQEAMCELGNIILNACMSAIADILGLTFDSSLPVYAVDSSEVILEQIIVAGDQAVLEGDQPVILVLHIDLVIEKRYSNGSLVFLLSSSSLKDLVSHVSRFIERI